MGPPGATPVTSPVADTVATAVFDEVHVIVRPATAAPLASLGVAASCVVAPAMIVLLGGVTLTLATVGGGGGRTTFEPPLLEQATSRNAPAAAVKGWCTPEIRVIVRLPQRFRSDRCPRIL